MSTLNPRAAQFQPSPLLQSAPPTVPASSKTSNGSRQKQRQPQSFSLTPAAIAGSKGPGISDKDWRASAANSTTKKSPLPDTLPNAVQDTTIVRHPEEDGRVIIRSLDNSTQDETQPEASTYDTKREHGSAHGFQQNRETLLQALEERFGAVNACHFSHEGWAVISFEKPHAAQMAQRFSKEKIGGELLKIEPIDAGDVETPTSNSVVLKNLPFQLEKDELEEQLEDLPVKPESMEMFTDSKGKFRGVAFVRYATAEDAREALRHFNGRELKGRNVQGEYRKTPLLTARKPEDGPLNEKDGKRTRARSRTSSMGSNSGKTGKNPFGSLNSPKQSPRNSPKNSPKSFNNARRRGNSFGEMREFSLDGQTRGAFEQPQRRQAIRTNVAASPLSNSPPVSFSHALPSYAYGESQLRQDNGMSRIPRSPLYLPGTSSVVPPPLEPLAEAQESEVSMSSSAAYGRMSNFASRNSYSEDKSVILRAAASSTGDRKRLAPAQKQFMFPARYAKGPSETEDTGFQRSRERTTKGTLGLALRRRLEEKQAQSKQSHP